MVKRRGKGAYFAGHTYKQATHYPNMVFVAGKKGVKPKRAKRKKR